MDRDQAATVWIIDSEHWPRACLRAELIERGYDAVGYVELDRALEAFRSADLCRPHLIVLELRGQAFTPSTLAALADASIPVIALAGTLEVSNPLVQGFKWAAVLSRPVTLGVVADTVEQVLRKL